MRSRLFAAALAASVCAAAIPAAAHHSTAMFDRTRTVTLEAVVTEFQWTNPHSWIEVDVTNRTARPDHYSIEGGSTRAMEKIGFKARTLKPGDKVVITIHPMKNGTKGGLLSRLVLPNGQTFAYNPA